MADSRGSKHWRKPDIGQIDICWTCREIYKCRNLIGRHIMISFTIRSTTERGITLIMRNGYPTKKFHRHKKAQIREM